MRFRTLKGDAPCFDHKALQAFNRKSSTFQFGPKKVLKYLLHMTGLMKHNSIIHNIFVDNRSGKNTERADDYLSLIILL